MDHYRNRKAEHVSNRFKALLSHPLRSPPSQRRSGRTIVCVVGSWAQLKARPCLLSWELISDTC